MHNDVEIDHIGKYDALFGKHLEVTDPLLSPKISLIVQT